MSSRREEKEQRRAQRIAAEEQAASAERRRRVLGIAAGALLGVAAVAAVVIVLAGGKGGGDAKPNRPTTTPRAKVPIPAPATTDLAAAAKAAGCQVASFTPGPNDREHLRDPNQRYPYKQNPPVFGPHYQFPASDGDSAGRPAPTTEMVVHALEHGRVVIWYRPAIGDRRIGQLETLFAEPFSGQPAGYKQLLVERPAMPFAVAASAWGHRLGCPTFDDKVFDALRDFRATYVDKAPENIPFPE